MYIQNIMPRYLPHQAFIQQINGGYPIMDDNGFVLNDNGEQVVGLEVDTTMELGHIRSKKLHIYFSKHQLLELRGILDAAIFDLYEGQEMSSMFDSDLK